MRHVCNIRLSLTYVTYLSFTHYWNAVESSYFYGKVIPYSDFEVKKSNAKVTVIENAEIVFAHIFLKCGSIYVKPAPKWLSQMIYTE